MYVSIDMDKPRQLRYDFNAIADIEERAGLGIMAMFNEQVVGFNTIRLLVWGGIKWAERGFTTEQAGKSIMAYLEKGNSLETLTNKIMLALQKSGVAEFKIEDETGNMIAETE